MRYYDPEAGRFVSRDPLGMWGDPTQRGNAQSYCGSNPVNRVDPLGLEGTVAGVAAVQDAVSQAYAQAATALEAQGELDKKRFEEELANGRLLSSEELGEMLNRRWAAQSLRAESQKISDGIRDGATVTIYVDQPRAGGDDDVLEMRDPGHTFLRIRDPKTGKDISVGYHPANGAGAIYQKSRGVVKDDSKHPWDVASPDYLLTRKQLADLLTFVADSQAGKIWKTYDLADANCTDWVWEALRRAKVPAPQPEKVFWPFFADRSTAPGPYGEVIRDLPGAKTSNVPPGPPRGKFSRTKGKSKGKKKK